MDASTSSPNSSRSPKQAKPRRRVTKNQFKKQTSILDSFQLQEDRGNIYNSEFQGFFNLVIIASFFFFFSVQTREVITHGTFVGLESVLKHFGRIDLFPAWVILVTLSFSAFFLQKILVWGLIPVRAVPIIQHLLQSTLVGYVLLAIRSREFPIVQTAFLLTEMIILLFKMHSYTVTNLELRKQEKKDEDLPIEARYPNNITLLNWIDFLLIPTFVYEPIYPRTEKIRWLYFLEKSSSFVVCWSILHVLSVSYIEPILQICHKISFLQAIVELIVPFMVGHLVIFYMVFDIGANAFAEITRFADRRFYDDWWNSTSFDEYARKWNRPVHEFLLRHIYLDSQKHFKFSPAKATFVTFLISSILHEFFLACLFGFIRPYILMLQMFQLPLIYWGKRFKGTRTGNFFFWWSMILGLPLLSVLYSREFWLQHQEWNSPPEV